MEKVSAGRRARTKAQKQLRRRVILDSANKHLGDVGYEAFSMAKLGKLAGVAKGTLYLYFETREDVLLALFCEKMAVWSGRFSEMVRSDSSDEQFARNFNDVMHSDSGILPLLSRLDSVIEHNVSLEKVIQSKRLMARMMTEIAEVLAPRLRLSVEQANDAVGSLTFLWLGTAQMGAGSKLDTSRLPDDVRQFAESFKSEQTFITNACRILSGIRAGQ